MKRRSQPTFARNQTELGRLLGVSRETVGRWLKIPGNPGRRSDGRLPMAEWKAWAEANSNRYLGPTGRELKGRLLEAQARLIEHKLDVSRRMHVSIEEVDRLAAKLAAVITKEIRKIHRIAADLENKTTAECEQILRDEAVATLERLRLGAEGIR